MRITKYIGARTCPADDSRVLMLVPTFPGERVKKYPTGMLLRRWGLKRNRPTRRGQLVRNPGALANRFHHTNARRTRPIRLVRRT